MPFPLLLGAGMLAAGVAKKIFGHKKESAQAKAAKAADDERVNAAQTNRVAKLDASSALLRGVQSGLRAGAPNYVLDDASLAKLKTAPAATHMADPTKGQGWGLAEGLAGGVGDALGTIALGKAQGAGGGGGGAAVPPPYYLARPGGSSAAPPEDDPLSFFTNWQNGWGPR